MISQLFIPISIRAIRLLPDRGVDVVIFATICASVQIDVELIVVYTAQLTIQDWLTDVLCTLPSVVPPSCNDCLFSAMWWTGRQHLSSYIDCDDYEARTTTTQTDDDDDDDTPRHYHHQQQQQVVSTSRLYDKRAAGAHCDVIEQVMQCNQPTPRLSRNTAQRQ